MRNCACSAIRKGILASIHAAALVALGLGLFWQPAAQAQVDSVARESIVAAIRDRYKDCLEPQAIARDPNDVAAAWLVGQAVRLGRVPHATRVEPIHLLG